MSSVFIDPYIDPSTGVLRNLIGASTYDELRNAEGELVSTRIGQFLSALPFNVSGSLSDFRAIHKYLFQDIYDWAGQVRNVEIRKNEEGSEFFLPSSNILAGFAWAQKELEKDDMLRGLSANEFCQRLAYHYDNYNFIHPFREGNGRTQRLFWTILSHDAGYDLDWRCISGEENDHASRLAAEDLDLSELVELFKRASSPCDPSIPLNAELAGTGHLK